MLFQQSLAPGVFARMQTQLYASANRARKLETQKRLDFYHDEHLDYLDEKLNELFSDPSSMVQCHLNIVKKIITQLAQVYRSPPARTIEGAEADQAIYEEMLQSCSFDVKIKQASRYVKLLKTILLRPVWRNGKLDLDVLDGSILDVVTGLTPEDLREVLITDYGTSGKIEDVSYSWWSAESWKRLDYQGNVTDEQENPYGILPFLPVWDRPPSDSFWLPGGSDLIALQEAINLKITDLLHLLACQSFGVGYIKGSPGGGNLKVDPGSLVELPENGEIGFESQEAQISEVVSAIDKLIKWACVSNGLSAASMSTDLSDRQSGDAKQVDRLELSELRLDDIALWRQYEKSLFQIMKKVWNTHNTKKLSESAKLKIDFADPSRPADPKTQAEAWNLLLDLGIISQVDCVMALNSDFTTREEALAHLLKIKEETKELTE